MITTKIYTREKLLKKILILFAHPALQKSRVNKHLIQDLDKIEGVTFHDLYQTYPEFDIDVKHEQKLLVNHEIIVFHHPFFWYSTPAILKEWQDLVLEHGWAYGRNGNALKDKIFFNTITSGGSKEAYQEKGYNRYTLKQLIAPVEGTATLCKMIFLPPFAIQGTHSITQEEVNEYQTKYYKILKMLRDDKLSIKRAQTLSYFNDYLED